jgi:hypothetical protein
VGLLVSDVTLEPIRRRAHRGVDRHVWERFEGRKNHRRKSAQSNLSPNEVTLLIIQREERVGAQGPDVSIEVRSQHEEEHPGGMREEASGVW